MASEAMSPRERLRAAFAGEPTDRVPWSPCLDGYFLSSLPEGNELDEAGVHRAIGADALLRHIMLYTSTGPAIGVRNRAAENPRIDFKVEPTPEGGHRIYYETAVGTIWEELIANPQSPNIPWFTKRKLETVEDVKIYMYALETARCDPHPETFRRVVESLGDDGLVTTTGPISPMEQFINLDMDVENVTYALADDPDTMTACFELMHEANLEAYRILAESEAEVVISYENLSTTLTSPDTYARFDLRHCNDYADICQKAGKTYLTHMCGRLSGFAAGLEQSRQDGFIDVAPAPTGDVRFGEAKRTWARDHMLVGGIDATAFASLGPVEMRRYVRERLDEIRSEAGELRKFILGSGDVVPKDASMEILMAVSETVGDYGCGLE